MSLLNGYPALYMPKHPRAYQNGMVYEHILKAEEKLGRCLLEKEVVHHIDHNRKNNSLENLLVFSTQEDHGRFHDSGEHFQFLVLQENGSYAYPLEKVAHLLKTINVCKICGKKISKSEYCIQCIGKYHMRSSHILNRDELKKLIRNTPFTTIGKQCHVSDNAVRKWCDSYGLPRRKQDIKKYSDEEWELL